MKNITSSNLSSKLPTNSQILVMSDIHLAARTTTASREVEKHLAARLRVLQQKPNSVVVLNGDIFELWAGLQPSVESAMAAHPKLFQALKAFGMHSTHKIIFVVGNHDAELAWNIASQQYLAKNFNAFVCLSLTLELGQKKLVFEHGHQLDPDNAIADPYNKDIKPFGQYIVQEALPLVAKTQGKLLAGINHLSEPLDFAKFTAARIFYREVLNRLWWLLIPIAVVFGLELIAAFGFSVLANYSLGEVLRFVLFGEVIFLLNFAVVFVVLAIIFRRLLARAKTMPQKKDGEHSNSLPTKYALDLYTKDANTIAYITGHTHKPSIVAKGEYFYANSGCGVETLISVPTYFKLPKPYASINKISWLELSASPKTLRIDLYKEQIDNNKLTPLEKLVTKKATPTNSLAVVDSLAFPLL